MRLCIPEKESVRRRQAAPTASGWLSNPVVCAALLLLSAPSVSGQSTAQPAVRPEATLPPASDPRRPEVQPNLSVDRDPIPSPDPDVSESLTNVPNLPARPGEIQKGENGVYTLHENVDEVLLNCTVIDEKGRPVEGLTQADFRVWEDSVQQRVTSFRHQDLPVSMGILIDDSGSMRDKRSVVNHAAMDLLRNSNRQDNSFVVNFSDRAYLDQGFTTDLVALNRGLSRFDSQGTTALYDAVAASADELSKDAKLQKQVLLIVSDGADNASRLSREQAIRRVQNLGGPVVYSIGLLFDSDPREVQRAKDALLNMSDDTGGIAYFPQSLEEVDQIAVQVAADIRNQYTIGYHSSKSASLGGYRVVHVEAYSPKYGKLSVRTRRGYYAKRQTSDQNAQSTTPQSNRQ